MTNDYIAIMSYIFLSLYPILVISFVLNYVALFKIVTGPKEEQKEWIAYHWTCTVFTVMFVYYWYSLQPLNWRMALYASIFLLQG